MKKNSVLKIFLLISLSFICLTQMFMFTYAEEKGNNANYVLHSYFDAEIGINRQDIKKIKFVLGGSEPKGEKKEVVGTGLKFYVNKDEVSIYCGDKNAKISILNDDSMYFFNNYLSLEEIENLKAIDFSNITDLSYMFLNCSSLKKIDLNSINTENVFNLKGMFAGCVSIESINIKDFNTSKVKNMSQMFSNCFSLKQLTVPDKFIWDSLIYASGMFLNCEALNNIDTSKFDIRNVAFMDSMFSGCSSLSSIDISKFDTRKVNNMSNLFSYCQSLKSINIDNLATNNVSNMSGMFAGCSLLEKIDVSKFDISKVTDMSGMFFACSSLKAIDLSKFNIKDNVKVDQMLGSTLSLANVNISSKLSSKINEAGLKGDWRGKDSKIYPYNDEKDATTLPNKEGQYERISSYRVVCHGDGENVFDSMIVYQDESANLKTPEKEGYTFSGWYKDETLKDLSTSKDNLLFIDSVKSNLDLWPKWEENTYKIKYELEGGSFLNNYKPLTSFKYTESVKLPTKDNVKKDNYYFIGWYDNSDYKGNAFVEVPKYTDNDITFYAKWERGNYTISFNPNGGFGEMVKQYAQSDKEYKLNGNMFMKRGFQFDSWTTNSDGTGKTYKNEESVKDLTSMNNDITLYAKWVPIKYTIKFNPNGDYGKEYSVNLSYDEYVKLDNPGFEREGYKLEGWSLFPGDDNMVYYEVGQKVKEMDSSNNAIVNLYAIWVKA